MALKSSALPPSVSKKAAPLIKYFKFHCLLWYKGIKYGGFMQTKIKDLSVGELETMISNTVKETMGDLLEDLFDLKTIEERGKETVEDYEAYSRRRKTRRHV